MRIASLCTGYGGLDHAVQAVIPADLAWVADNDPGATKILAHRHPDVPNHGDITRVDWGSVEPVDILTAGFPCQSVSNSGRKEGIRGDIIIPAGQMGCGCRWADHDPDRCTAASPPGPAPSRLTGPEQIRAITELNDADRNDPAGPPPQRTIEGTASGIWFNVAHAIGVLRPRLVFLENVSALTIRGMDAVLGQLSQVGFDTEWTTLRASDVGAPHRRERIFILAWPADADPAHIGHQRGGHPRGGRPGPENHGHPAPHTTGLGHGHPRTEGLRRVPATPVGGAATRPVAAHPDSAGLPGLQQKPQGAHGHPQLWDDAERRGEGDWGRYEPSIRRWERAMGRIAPARTEPGQNGQPRLNPRLVEWMMGLPDLWVTGVPGLSRTQQLRALGNGVVPQQGALALRSLLARVAAEQAT